MRILHLINHIRDAGNGLTNVCIDLAVEQSRMGADVRVASGGGEFSRLLEAEGVTTSWIEFADRSPRGALRSLLQLRSVIREFDPQVVHSHTITPAVLALPLARTTVATVHNEYQRGVSAMGLSKAVVGVSGAVTEAMKHRGVPMSRLHTVVNGPTGSLRRWPPADSVRLPPHTFVMVGAVSALKGADLAVRAMAELVRSVPDARLLLIGDNHLPGIEEQAADLGLQNAVEFLGFQPRPERYMAEAVALIMPSRRESLGLVALEAQCEGTPVIGFAIDGIPEALAFGEAGLLVTPGDPSALAEAMRRLAHDQVMRGRLADGARRHAHSRSTARMAREYMDVYSGLLARGRA